MIDPLIEARRTERLPAARALPPRSAQGPAHAAKIVTAGLSTSLMLGIVSYLGNSAAQASDSTSGSVPIVPADVATTAPAVVPAVVTTPFTAARAGATPGVQVAVPSSVPGAVPTVVPGSIVPGSVVPGSVSVPGTTPQVISVAVPVPVAPTPAAPPAPAPQPEAPPVVTSGTTSSSG